MIMLVNREVLLAKIEGTYGFDPVPVPASDSILVSALNWNNEGARMNERPAARSSLAPLQHIFGGTLRSISFDAEIKGSGVAGTAPEIGTLLRGCAFAETIVASTSVEYKPASTGHESLTFYYYQDGTLMKLTGSRGSVVFNLEAGKQGMASFTFTGHSEAANDAALVIGAYDSTVPAPFIGAGFSLGAYAAVVSKLTCDISNQVATPPNPNAADGYGDIQITGRDVAGSFDPEHVLVVTKPFEADWRAGILETLTTGTVGSVAGNRFSFNYPSIYAREISPADRDAIRTLEYSFGPVETATDDELSILFN